MESSQAMHCKDWLYFKLTGVRALNLLDPASRPALREVLEATGVLPRA